MEAQPNNPGRKHRLRRRDLVTNIFSLFSEEFERSDAESIWEIEIPMEGIKNYLQEKHSITYKSNHWVYTQLKRYEEELGVKLFRKDCGGKDKQNFFLAIHQPFRTFFQKQHLYVTQKLKVANGVYDQIKNFALEVKRGEPVTMLMGAGTTLYLLAGILANKSWEDDIRYTIFTHNVGCLREFIDPRVNHRNFEVFTPQGWVDPITYTILERDNALLTSRGYDFIVQGTSCVCEGKLYIESEQERARKEAILKNCSGRKILVLTKHEFCDTPLKGCDPYGSLEDYDCIVVPRSSCEAGVRKRYEILFEEHCRRYSPQIISWNYEILTVSG